MILDAIHKVPTATVLAKYDSPLLIVRPFIQLIQYGFDTDKSEPQLVYNMEGNLCCIATTSSKAQYLC